MEISTKKPFPVKIGAIILYCEKMTLQTKTDISTTPTVTGTPYYTNKCRKPTRISFTGRIYDKENPMMYAALANNINGTENYQIIYKKYKFINCIITGINVIDSSEDFIELTIEATTLNISYFVSEVEE